MSELFLYIFGRKRNIKNFQKFWFYIRWRLNTWNVTMAATFLLSFSGQIASENSVHQWCNKSDGQFRLWLVKKGRWYVLNFGLVTVNRPTASCSFHQPTDRMGHPKKLRWYLTHVQKGSFYWLNILIFFFIFRVFLAGVKWSNRSDVHFLPHVRIWLWAEFVIGLIWSLFHTPNEVNPFVEVKWNIIAF